MWGKIKNLWLTIKEYAIEAALWAEILKGLSGADKKKAVVDKLTAIVSPRLKYVPQFVIRFVLGFAVEQAVSKLNLATTNNFGGLSLDFATVSDLAATPLKNAKAIETTLSPDERFKRLCESYGIKDEEPPVALPKLPTPTPMPIPIPTQSNFDKCLEFIKLAEGGRNFDVVGGKAVLKPGIYDTGGATAYGITWKTLDKAYARGVVKHCDITKLTQEQAVEIYKNMYWDDFEWDGLPYPLCLCAFDVAVNGGLGYTMQDALNEMGENLVVDEIYGRKTKEALFRVGNSANAIQLVQETMKSRKEWFDICISRDAKKESSRNGWYRRLRNLAATCGVESPV